jgi:alginate O-acetyltransferase complex protein AlgJ
VKRALLILLLGGLALAGSFGLFLETGVTQGKNGWLFHIAEFGVYTAEQPQDIEDKLRFIGATSQLLKKKGITLVVALVPAKIHLYQTHLPDDLPLTETMRNRYQRALSSLSSYGVTSVDLLTPMRQGQLSKEEANFPVYQKLDHHFSSRGALIAAKAVADKVRQVIKLSDLPKVKFSLKAKPQEFYEESSLLQRLPQSEQTKYLKEAFIPYELVRPSSGLLQSSDPAVILVGSSASKGGRMWPFEYGIPYYLGVDVANAAQIGRGPWLPLEDYLTNPMYQLKHPKVIIWQLWESFLLDVDQANLPEDWAARLGALIEDGSSLPNLNLPKTNATAQEITLPSTMIATDSLLLEVSSPKLERVKLEVIGLKSRLAMTLRLGNVGQKYRLKIPLALNADSAKMVRLFADSKNLKVFRVQRYGLSPTMSALLEPKGVQNLLQRTDRLQLLGFADLEANGIRWAMGSQTSVGFWSLNAKTITLDMDIFNPIENQEVRWFLNDQPLELWQGLKAEEIRQQQIVLTPLRGKNTLRMQVKFFNGSGSDFAKDEARGLSVMFNRFQLIF